MKKLKLFLGLSFFAFAGLVSCNDDDSTTLDGGSSVIVGFTKDVQNGTFVTDGTDKDLTVPVQILGGHNGLPSSSDITISYSLDTANSTAVEGFEFDFVNATGSVVLPSDNFSTSIGLVVHTANLVVDDNKKIVLNLTAVNDDNIAVIGFNQRTIEINLFASCYSNLAGSYTNVTTRLDPAGGPYTWTTETIFQVSEGVYRTTNVGQYYANGGPVGTGATANLPLATHPDGGYTFTDICGNLIMENQNLGNVYTNLVSQSAAQKLVSSVDPITGVITIEYTINFASGDRTWRSVYTPN